jgi:ABC-type multidrug transport system fused ATPase/permease subunit
MERLPRHIFRFVFATSLRHQVSLALLGAAIFLLELGPLEMQRRIVDILANHPAFGPVAILCLAYAAIVAVQGGTKLGFNLYRSWLGEHGTRELRKRLGAMKEPDHAAGGVQLSMMLSEVEDVGGFVSEGISEPLLSAGILLSVLAYMLHLQPVLTIVMLVIWSPNQIYVPLLQLAINQRAALRVATLRAVSADMLSDGGTAGSGGAIDTARIDQVFELNMGIFRRKFTMNFLMNLFHRLEMVGVLMLGGWYVVHGEMQIGGLVAFVSAIGRLNDPWGDLVAYFASLTSAQAKYRLFADEFNTMAGRSA